MLTLIKRNYTDGQVVSDWVCNSEDTFPEDVGNGSSIFVMDTRKTYYYDVEAGGWIGAPDETYLVSVEVTTPPTKVAYEAGETFAATGAAVTGTFSDDSTDDVTDAATWIVNDPLTVDDEAVDVAVVVNGITRHTTQAITVTEPEEEETPGAEGT